MQGTMTDTVVRHTPNVALLNEVEIVNLKPKARIRTSFLLTFAEGTVQRYIPPTRLGYYGHWEYTLPSGLKVVVSVNFQERVASSPDVYRHKGEEAYKPFLKEGAGDRE
jgi:hypothetical protein